jgi:hypothetical protein
MQYDLNAGSSAAIIASCDTILYNPGTNSIGALQLGPDGRIYVAVSNYTFLGCIQNPSLAGTACNYNGNYISLPNSSAIGLPGFVSSYFCNTNTGLASVTDPASLLSVYPNPARNTLYIKCDRIIYWKGVFKIDIINSAGQNVASKSFAESHEENNFEIPLTGFSKGIYLVRIFGNGKALSEKFIVE